MSELVVTKPKLSVVIPVYNGAAFVRDCLTSLINDTKGAQLEIICVDDGSADNSIAELRNFSGSIIILQNDGNHGFAYTCNRGLKTCKGDVILLLNQDTRIQPGAIDILHEKLERDPKIGFIGPKFVGFDGKLQKACRAFPTLKNLTWRFTGLARLFPGSKLFNEWSMRWFDHEREMIVDQPMGAALMFRRSLMEEIGFLDESYPIFFNDVDWCKRAVDAGYHNLYFPDAVVEHFIGSATRPQKPRMVWESHKSLYRYLYRHNNQLWKQSVLWLWWVILMLSASIRSQYWKLAR